jgi:hypothetical protein
VWAQRIDSGVLADNVADSCSVTALLNAAAAYGHRIRHVDWREATHCSRTAVQIARSEADVRRISATALPRKHSSDAHQQPCLAVVGWQCRPIADERRMADGVHARTPVRDGGDRLRLHSRSKWLRWIHAAAQQTDPGFHTTGYPYHAEC